MVPPLWLFFLPAGLIVAILMNVWLGLVIITAGLALAWEWWRHSVRGGRTDDSSEHKE